MEVKQGKARGVQLLAAAILIFCMLPIFWIGTYARPSADDYDFSHLVHAAMTENGTDAFTAVKGAWEVNLVDYHSWQGTYTANFFMALQPGLWGEKCYALTPVLLTAMVFFILWGCAHVFQKYLLPHPVLPDALLALLGTFLIVEQMPYPNQGLFWWNGGMYYTPYSVLVFANLALLVKLYFAQGRARRAGWCLAASLMAFFIAGGNNVSAFLNILLLFLAMAVFLRRKNGWAVPPFLVAVAGFAMVYFAPGTSVRKGGYANQSLFGSMALALFQGAKTMLGWVTLGLLCSLALLTPLALAAAKANRLHFQFRWPLVPVILSYLLLSAMWFVPRYAVGNFGAPRLTNAIWITFLVFAFLDYTYFLGWLLRTFALQRKAEGLSPRRRKAACLLAAAFCLVGVLGCGNRGNCEYGTSTEALVEIAIGNAAAYTQQCDARIAQYHDPALSTVELAPIGTKATLLYVSDIASGDMDWAYGAISAYYGKTIQAAS
ncbi:MAG: DUF6056 family protein [Faecalibacterium sp.]|jgi:hypothetical protein|nr:DUF6056 family protein [Faecalibacterium sp.]